MASTTLAVGADRRALFKPRSRGTAATSAGLASVRARCYHPADPVESGSTTQRTEFLTFVADSVH